MLSKSLELGGLQVGGPRTKQHPARFRVANNVYQTRDGEYVPRFGNQEYLVFDAAEVIVASRGFRDKPFVITRSADGTLNFYHDSTTKLPCPTSIPKLTLTGDQSLSNGVSFVENIGCLFFNIPKLGVYKYDGVSVYRSGVPLPWNLFTGATGIVDPAFYCYVRTFAYRIDAEGNIVTSGYTQTRGVNFTGSDFSINYSGNSATYTTPTTREVYDDFTLGANDFYAVGTITGAAGANSVTFTATEHNLKVGCRVFLTAPGGPKNGVWLSSLRVESVAGNTIVLSTSDIMGYNHSAGGWQTPTSQTGAGYYTTYAGSTVLASSTLLSVWTSNAETGNYVWKVDTVALPKTAGVATFALEWSGAITSPETAFPSYPYNGTNMGDVYDVTTVKGPIPCMTDDFDTNSLTTYDGNLYVGQKEVVYYSDTSTGGSFESANGTSFITVGNADEGRNVGVCGNDEFLVVSRREQAYVLQGNIPTANYSVKLVKTGAMGAYTSESMVRLDEHIVLINKMGVWVIRGGGKAEEQSEPIRDLFDNFSNTMAFEEEGFWNINSYPMFVDNEANQFLRASYDRARDLIVFYENGGKCLVLNVSNGEFTTFSGITGGKLQTLTFILDKYYAGAGNKLYVEDKTSANKYAYANTSPVRMTPTWFTAGEPSLEKKTRQLKIWGMIEADVTIYQQRDWNETKVAQDTYKGIAGVFSHKKRIESANVLSMSVTMEFKNIVRMEIEGLELEFSPIQEGMKR